jgi:hypothetical protein
VRTIRDLLYAVQFRLFGRCFICDRLMALHTPRRLDRCETTPLPIALTARGWLVAQGVDPSTVDAWCHANGIPPDATVQPVAPVSHARIA